MRPERELLFDQATACRQLALIAGEDVAERLRKLAEEYETIAQRDTGILRTNSEARAPSL